MWTRGVKAVERFINTHESLLMKKTILSLMALSCLTASAQFGAPRENPKVPSVTANVTEDFKPATSNQDNKQYPMVNSQRMVRAQIKAPDAKFFPNCLVLSIRLCPCLSLALDTPPVTVLATVVNGP